MGKWASSVSYLVLAMLISSTVPTHAANLESAPQTALAALREERPQITEAILAWLNAPEDASYFGKDRDDYKDDLDDLLDGALDSLGLDEGRKIRQAVIQLDSKMAELDAELAELETERTLGALPQQANLSRVASYNPLTRTIEKVEEEIEVARLRREEAQESRAGLVEEFRNRTAEIYAIDLDARRAESLLYQANGLDLIETAETVKVLTQIEARLGASLSGQQGSNPALRRQYHEIAVITRLLIRRLNERHLTSYDSLYLPALAALREQHEKVAKASEKTAAAAATENQKQVMARNLSLQGDLGKALEAYSGILQAGKDKTGKMLAQSMQEADVALSTLATYDLATDLSDLGARHFEELSSLTALSAPDLMPIEDEELFQQLVEVSRQLPGG